MKLEDIISKNLRYDVRAIDNDEELSRQIQTILVNLGIIKGPVDGIFGPMSTAGLDRFQKQANCGEAGFLGTITAQKLLVADKGDVGTPPPILKVTVNTVLKSKPISASELTDAEKQIVNAGQQFEIISYEPTRAHIRVALRNDAFKGSAIWHIYELHGGIYEQDQLVYPKPVPVNKTIKLNIPYKSQLDNWYNPTGSCNVTSLAMCLEFLGTTRKTRSGQFEDELYEYALNSGYSRHDPYDLARIVRDYGMKDTFKNNGKIEEIQQWLLAGKPVVIHGYFTSFGHIVVVSGFDEQGFFVHDPYGEWFSTGYNTKVSGKYLHYSYNMIRRLCMPDGNFWVHFISK